MSRTDAAPLRRPFSLRISNGLNRPPLAPVYSSQTTREQRHRGWSALIQRDQPARGPGPEVAVVAPLKPSCPLAVRHVALAQGSFEGSRLAGLCLFHAAGLRQVLGPSKGHHHPAASFSTPAEAWVLGVVFPPGGSAWHGSRRACASSARQR